MGVVIGHKSKRSLTVMVRGKTAHSSLAPQGVSAVEYAARLIVKDDRAQIAAQLRRWIEDPDVDVVISTGGTGLTGRDVTVEAFKSVFEKEIDGFSVLFHQISYEKVGTSTIQSRACAGVAKGKYLFALPGSPGAVKDGWDTILKSQLDIRHRPCNFVEIMPRLLER